MNKINLKAMKRIIYFFYFLLISVVSFSQPNFTSDDIPYLGDRDTLRFLNYQAIDNDLMNETGSNYQWDFSWLPFETFPTFIDTVTYRVPTHAISLSIPDATMEDISFGSSGGHLNVYALRNDSLILYRQGGNLSGGIIFSPPVTDIVFPISYDNQFDSFTEFFIINGGGQTVYIGDRNNSVKYDGYGSLSLPWGNFTDVFRIHKVVKDSTYSIGTTVTYDTYTWYKKGGYVPLLSLQYSGASNLYFVFASLGRGISGPSSIVEIDKAILKAFPIPAENILNIDGCSAQSAKIYSLSGQMIQDYPQISNNRLDVSNIKKGIYIVKVVDNHQKVFSLKLLK